MSPGASGCCFQAPLAVGFRRLWLSRARVAWSARGAGARSVRGTEGGGGGREHKKRAPGRKARGHTAAQDLLSGWQWAPESIGQEHVFYTPGGTHVTAFRHCPDCGFVHHRPKVLVISPGRAEDLPPGSQLPAVGGSHLRFMLRSPSTRNNRSIPQRARHETQLSRVQSGQRAAAKRQ